MIADIYIDVERHLNANPSKGPPKETKNDTDEISDYGRHRRDRRLHSTPATRETARGAGACPFIGLTLVYASTNGREMNNIIEDNGEDQFANGQSSRSLRVNSDATEPQIQLDAGPTTLEEFITKHRKAFA